MKLYNTPVHAQYMCLYSQLIADVLASKVWVCVTDSFSYWKRKSIMYYLHETFSLSHNSSAALGLIMRKHEFLEQEITACMAHFEAKDIVDRKRAILQAAVLNCLTVLNYLQSMQHFSKEISCSCLLFAR